MPYRCRGTWVQKKEKGQWKNWRKRPNAKNCKAMATALNMRHAKIPEKKED